MTSPVVLALREAVVPCENEMDDALLRTTYLPLPKLVRICEELEVGQAMPFLELRVEADGGTNQDWNFLKMFDVGREADVRFRLDVLRHFVQNHESLSELSRQTPL